MIQPITLFLLVCLGWLLFFVGVWISQYKPEEIENQQYYRKLRLEFLEDLSKWGDRYGDAHLKRTAEFYKEQLAPEYAGAINWRGLSAFLAEHMDKYGANIRAQDVSITLQLTNTRR